MTGKPGKRITLRFPHPAMAGVLLWLLASVTSAGGTLQPFAGTGPAPGFSLPNLKGTTRTLADYRGKVVLVNFWASWCPPCIQEMPGLQRLQDRLASQPFEILPVNVGEQKYRVWKFVKLIDFTLPVLLDTRSKTLADWNASVLPTSFLLDRAGRIRYRVQGDLEWDSEQVVSLIKALINEEENEQ